MHKHGLPLTPFVLDFLESRNEIFFNERVREYFFSITPVFHAFSPLRFCFSLFIRRGCGKKFLDKIICSLVNNFLIIFFRTTNTLRAQDAAGKKGEIFNRNHFRERHILNDDKPGLIVKRLFSIASAIF